MTLETLRAFCDVARQRSFSRAAALHGLSQPAVSQAVLQLERRLGVQLIDRSKRPIELTHEGTVFYDGCRDLVERYVRLEARTRASHAESSSHVTAAAIYSLVLYDMGRFVDLFAERHPQGQVRLEYLHPEQVYQSVVNERVDLGLMSFPPVSRQLEVIPWRQEPMVLVCGPAHHLAARQTLPLDGLNGEAFVAFDANLTIRRKIDSYLRAHHVEVDVVMAFDNVEAIKRGIETGAGVSILPEPTVRREVDRGALVQIDAEPLELQRSLCIIHRRGRRLTRGMETFIQLLTRDTGKPTGNVLAGVHLAGTNGQLSQTGQAIDGEGVSNA